MHSSRSAVCYSLQDQDDKNVVRFVDLPGSENSTEAQTKSNLIFFYSLNT
jgi:hypothetical protein